MDFWKSVTEAAEKAKDVARVVSQKGLVRQLSDTSPACQLEPACC